MGPEAPLRSLSLRKRFLSCSPCYRACLRRVLSPQSGATTIRTGNCAGFTITRLVVELRLLPVGGAVRYMPKARTITFFLAAATSLCAHNNGALAEAPPCRSMEYERNPYTVCEADLRKHIIRLYWKRLDGIPYAYLSALPRALEGEAGRLLFATNAGMFDPALKPVGLYVEQGRELVHANATSGYGNFHMKPNGVFYVSVDRAAVAETRAFLKQRPQADLATQSGPMLVINGRLHPRFDRHSTSLKTRNGVGVRADGKVIFAISQGEVSFDAFARLFRDGLNCPNALFLDGGSASSLYAPSLNRHGNILSLGPMLAVFERNPGASR
jgi:uncharacterized protein YigE (DUF2233 family)